MHMHNVVIQVAQELGEISAPGGVEIAQSPLEGGLMQGGGVALTGPAGQIIRVDKCDLGLGQPSVPPLWSDEGVNSR